MDVRYCAWTKLVDATMLTISSTTRTAKLERLMESPRIERVLFVVLLLLQCKLRCVANHEPKRLLNLWKSDLVNNRRMLIARLNLGSQAPSKAHDPRRSLSIYLWKYRGMYEKR